MREEHQTFRIRGEHYSAIREAWEEAYVEGWKAAHHSTDCDHTQSPQAVEWGWQRSAALRHMERVRSPTEERHARERAELAARKSRQK